MKIIKPGVLPVKKTRIFEGICKKCGCQVELPEGEAQSVGERGFGGEGRIRFYVACPTENCGAVIDLKEIVYR